MLDSHALQVFYEAARANSFTAAAKVLHLSQPAVSMQIKGLEEYLQTDLFERNGRYLRLTQAGETLVPLAQQIVQLSVAAEETLRHADGQVSGSLTVGASAFSASYVLPHLVARFQRLYPEVSIVLRTSSQEELVEKLVTGEYDFGVMNVVAQCEHVICRPFFNEQIVLVAPAAHPFAQRKQVKPEELGNERYICQDKTSACRWAVGNALDRYGVDIEMFDIAMEVTSPEAIITAVEHGMGLSFISMLTAAPRLALGRIAIIDVAGVELETSVHIAYHESKLTNPVQTRFKAFLNHPQTRSLISLLTEGRMV